jgi:hypothetical protein
MANTVSLLNYTNTFGEWVIATNALAKENNDLAANNYVKPTGTLFLNSPTLGLQVANNAIVGGQLQIQGTGSSAYIQNNLRVDTQVYFTNTALGLTNAGQANIGGPLLALASNTGLTVSNNATIGGNLTVTKTSTSNASFANIVTANNYVTTPTAFIGNYFWANNATGQISRLNVLDQLTVSGSFVITGATSYDTNLFTINTGSTIGLNSYFNVNRGISGANASIRWNEGSKYWDILDVDSATYTKIITLTSVSDSVNSTSSLTIATSNAVNILNNTIISSNTAMKGYVDAANTAIKSYVDVRANTNSSLAQSAFNKANTAGSTLVGTTGSATPTNTIIGFTSTNGITIVGSSNTMTFNTPQDLRTSASPTFASLSLTSPLQINQGGTGATSAAGALVNLLPSGGGSGQVLTTGGTGSYYWSTGGSGGGGGSSVGTLINTTRLFPTANASQTVFATPTYTVGTGQLRVYINGVRQFPSDYLETSNSSVTLTSGTTAGDTVMMEVDGYTNYTYYANTISFTAPYGNIVSSANTVQLAIQDLESRKVATSSNAQFLTVGVNTTPDVANPGTIRATGSIVASYSDERLKTKLGTIDNALDKLMTLSGFFYEANETAQSLGYNTKREVGLSAQEVQKVLPEVVVAAPISDEYLTVQYERIVPLIIEAIKELKSEIDVLKGK